MGSTRRDASLSLEKDPEQAAEAGSPATTEATFSEAGGVTVAAEQCTVGTKRILQTVTNAMAANHSEVSHNEHPGRCGLATDSGHRRSKTPTCAAQSAALTWAESSGAIPFRTRMQSWCARRYSNRLTLCSARPSIAVRI
jgi:hypothetical protein